MTDASVDLRELFGAGAPGLAVSDVTSHSARVQPGGLFLACQGYRSHGLEFLQSALERRPAAVAWEPSDAFDAPEFPEGVVGLRVDDLGARVGDIADRFFGRPSARLHVAGVTGTNGKTTTAWLASRALEKLGRTSAYMGTLGYGIGTELEPSALTTPGCISVHRRLRALADAGAEVAVMEVSSHALDQGRVDGVRVRTAAFTNLSRDHLDYHGSLANYREAKARLFDMRSLETAVVHTGDPFGLELAKRCAPRVDVLSVALDDRDAGHDAALSGSLVRADAGGLELALAGRFGEARLSSPLWGRFNAENLLVAAGILLALGHPLDDVAASLGECEAPPGRMQRLPSSAGQPTVIVDFAHTPDALRKLLDVARGQTGGRVVVVFGCGGERDQGKRAEMGAVADALADRIVLTNDNPRNEDPDRILADIVTGIRVHAPEIVPDRAAAIRAAITDAGPADVVLIAGKGSEDYQLSAGKSEAFSDAAVARGILEECA